MLPSAETLLALLLPRWQCQEQVSYRSHLIDVCPHLRVLSNADTLKQSCQILHAGPVCGLQFVSERLIQKSELN